jgi:tRNA threonylcarbamoyladenosine biosynthesis protein TsaB
VLILAIETSTSKSSVCLGRHDGLLASASLGRGQSHSEFLTPAIEFCLRQAGASVEELTGVAVSLGPGLYTGMRVGIAAAQALAHARSLPVVGIGSLDLVAFPHRLVRRDRLVAAVIDARRGELFWAFYRPAQDGLIRVSELMVGRPDKLAAELEATPEGTICVGDGAVAHTGLLTDAGAQVGSIWTAYPQAEALTELAIPRFVREESQRPEDLRPIYLRTADARINWAKRGRMAGGGPAPGSGSDAAVEQAP